LKKQLPLLVLVFVVLFVIGGYIVHTSTNSQQAPITVRDVKVPPTQNVSDGRSLNESSSKSSGNISGEMTLSARSIEETNVPSVDPKAGEIIVYGEVKAVDVDKRVLTVDQQMDDNSVKVSPNIPLNKDAVIRSKQKVLTMAQMKPGDSVGVIVTKDGKARAVLVNY